MVIKYLSFYDIHYKLLESKKKENIEITSASQLAQVLGVGVTSLMRRFIHYQITFLELKNMSIEDAEKTFGPSYHPDLLQWTFKAFHKKIYGTKNKTYAAVNLGIREEKLDDLMLKTGLQYEILRDLDPAYAEKYWGVWYNTKLKRIVQNNSSRINDEEIPNTYLLSDIVSNLDLDSQSRTDLITERHLSMGKLYNIAIQNDDGLAKNYQLSQEKTQTNDQCLEISPENLNSDLQNFHNKKERYSDQYLNTPESMFDLKSSNDIFFKSSQSESVEDEIKDEFFDDKKIDENLIDDFKIILHSKNQKIIQKRWLEPQLQKVVASLDDEELYDFAICVINSSEQGKRSSNFINGFFKAELIQRRSVLEWCVAYLQDKAKNSSVQLEDKRLNVINEQINKLPYLSSEQEILKRKPERRNKRRPSDTKKKVLSPLYNPYNPAFYNSQNDLKVKEDEDANNEECHIEDVDIFFSSYESSASKTS